MPRGPSDPNKPRVNRQTRNLVGLIKSTVPMLREALAEADVTSIRAHASAIATNASKLAQVAALAQPPAETKPAEAPKTAPKK